MRHEQDKKQDDTKFSVRPSVPPSLPPSLLNLPPETLIKGLSNVDSDEDDKLNKLPSLPPPSLPPFLPPSLPSPQKH